MYYQCFPTRGKACKDTNKSLTYNTFHFLFSWHFPSAILSSRSVILRSHLAILSSHFVILSEIEGSFLPKNEKMLKFFSKKFGSKDFYRTFAIPIQRRGGGEMVDTLLWGGSGSNPVRVRVSPTAPRDQHKRWSLFLYIPKTHSANGLNVALGCVWGRWSSKSVGSDFPSNLYRRCQKTA